MNHEISDHRNLELYGRQCSSNISLSQIGLETPWMLRTLKLLTFTATLDLLTELNQGLQKSSKCTLLASQIASDGII